MNYYIERITLMLIQTIFLFLAIYVSIGFGHGIVYWNLWLFIYLLGMISYNIILIKNNDLRGGKNDSKKMPCRLSY